MTQNFTPAPINMETLLTVASQLKATATNLEAVIGAIAKKPACAHPDADLLALADEIEAKNSVFLECIRNGSDTEQAGNDVGDLAARIAALEPRTIEGIIAQARTLGVLYCEDPEEMDFGGCPDGLLAGSIVKSLLRLKAA